MSHRSVSRMLSPLLLIVAVISLLAMPLDYRAGARSPHPHAALQLLAELAGGTLHHHLGASAATAPSPLLFRTVSHAAAGHDLALTGAWPVGEGVPGGGDDDPPRLTVAGQTASMSLLPVAALLPALVFLRSLERTLAWSEPAPLAATAPMLDTPPPRVVILRLDHFPLS